MTKENLIKLLEEKSDIAWDLHKNARHDRKHAMSNQFFGEYMTYREILFILTDPEFAAKSWELHFPDTPMEKEAI